MVATACAVGGGGALETLRRFGMTELRPGQFVLVRFGPGSKGMMAAEIQPEAGSPGLSSH